jgi:dephospho-CoA kinase
MLIVAITGMPGAGKSTAAKALERMGMRRIVMGDVIRAETIKRGLEANEHNTGEVMRDLRAKFGETAVAELCIKIIKDSKSERVVIDGIRSISEVDSFRRIGRVLLIAIHASRERRYALLTERGRTDDPHDYQMFLTRDQRELDIGIGEAIALANEAVSNEHVSPDVLSRVVMDTAKAWMDASK